METVSSPRAPAISCRRRTFDSCSLNSAGKSAVFVGGDSSVHGTKITGSAVSMVLLTSSSLLPRVTRDRSEYLMLGCANLFPVTASTSISPSSRDGGSCRQCSGRSGLRRGIVLGMLKWKVAT